MRSPDRRGWNHFLHNCFILWKWRWIDWPVFKWWTHAWMLRCLPRWVDLCSFLHKHGKSFHLTNTRERRTWLNLTNPVLDWTSSWPNTSVLEHLPSHLMKSMPLASLYAWNQFVKKSGGWGGDSSSVKCFQINYNCDKCMHSFLSCTVLPSA